MDLFNSNFDTLNAFARKEANAASLVSNRTFSVGMNSKVAAQLCAFTSALSLTCLTNNYLSGVGLLATIELNAKAPTGAVAIILGCTTGFDV
jgi:hypothetical protein